MAASIAPFCYRSLNNRFDANPPEEKSKRGIIRKSRQTLKKCPKRPENIIKRPKKPKIGPKTSKIRVFAQRRQDAKTGCGVNCEKHETREKAFFNMKNIKGMKIYRAEAQ